MDGEHHPGKIVFDPVEPDREAEVVEKRVVRREPAPRPVFTLSGDDEDRSRAPAIATGVAVTLGLVAVIAVWYGSQRSQSEPDEVTAYCVDQYDKLADESVCDEAYVSSHGGYYSGGTFFMPQSSGFGSVQYHYNYGGNVANGRVVGGSITRPPDGTEVKTPSGKTVQRGGFGSSAGGKSGGS